MQVRNIGMGNHATYEVSGTVLTINGHSIDVAARQTERPVLVNLFWLNGEITEKPSGVGLYLASIQIPAREMLSVQSGEGDDAQTVFEPAPVNMDAVSLILWPINQ